jgi:hypothetical protein
MVIDAPPAAADQWGGLDALSCLVRALTESQTATPTGIHCEELTVADSIKLGSSLGMILQQA